VGIGNDVMSFGKDYAEHQLNLATTLMHERGLPLDEALESLVRMHDEALEAYDSLADTLGSFGPEADGFAARWLQDVRYASLGFSLWESQAPRYTAHQIVSSGKVIQPRFSFFPPPSSGPASRPGSRPSSRPSAWPTSRAAGPPSSRRFSTLPPRPAGDRERP
jgi:hypothetical protein